MKKILITGSTSGIGLETAKALAGSGHHLLLHGRNRAKVEECAEEIARLGSDDRVECYVADLSSLAEVDDLARDVAARHDHLDVLINNAGVYTVREARTADGLDARFAVNTVAPFLLTQRLLERLGPGARVVNLSSAAQAPVDLDALAGRTELSDGAAYAQSKLALTMWSRALAEQLGADGPVVVAVNPGSLLATDMVKDAYGIQGNDISIGSGILVRAALDDEFAHATGQYFDNDARRFANPHPDALDPAKVQAVVAAIEAILGAR